MKFFQPSILSSGPGSGTVTSITTSGSITGGTITTTGNLSLVNDNATPGNFYYYGTNGAGTKGFYTLPLGGILLETNGISNGSQVILNLISGTGINLTDDGVGGVTIDATGGAGTPSMQTANYGDTVDYSAGAPANNTNLSFDDNSTPNTGTVYLPDGVGTIGDVITINDLLGVSSTSNIIIDAGGGNTITWSGGVTQTALMSVDGSSYTLRLISATQWMLE